jgi:hypothetical protein
VTTEQSPQASGSPGLIPDRLPTESEALGWVDRNSLIGKGKNWYRGRIVQIKEKVYQLLSTLDIKRDAIVLQQCHQFSFMFPAVYFAAALVRHVNSIESSGNKNKRQKFMEACLEDGLGYVPELLAAFVQHTTKNAHSRLPFISVQSRLLCIRNTIPVWYRQADEDRHAKV